MGADILDSRITVNDSKLHTDVATGRMKRTTIILALCKTKAQTAMTVTKARRGKIQILPQFESRQMTQAFPNKDSGY